MWENKQICNLREEQSNHDTLQSSEYTVQWNESRSSRRWPISLSQQQKTTKVEQSNILTK